MELEEFSVSDCFLWGEMLINVKLFYMFVSIEYLKAEII